MSEGPREYEFFNFDAANELEKQSARARRILERLAAHLAATDPQRDPNLKDLVEQEHVHQAARFLFGFATVSGVQTAPTSHCVFVSFSHEDGAFVSDLTERLAEAGITFFKADRDIQPAFHWAEAIWEAIRGCRVFLSVVTPRFIKSRWFDLEVGAACASNKKVLPVLRYVDQCDVPVPFDRFQSLVVENTEQLGDLIRELRELCSN